MTSCEWAAAVTAMAIAIAQDRSREEVEFLSLLFTQLGDTLATLAVEPPTCLS
jgi:uncharacterized protein HemY